MIKSAKENETPKKRRRNQATYTNLISARKSFSFRSAFFMGIIRNPKSRAQKMSERFINP